MKLDPFRILLPLQLAIVAGGIGMTAVAPPAQGEMLLLPILPGSAAHLAADAIDRGGRIVALGPIAGSIVVSGKRDAIARGLFSRGVMVIAAPDVLCGTKSREAAS